jgi:hypothetical protein
MLDIEIRKVLDDYFAENLFLKNDGEERTIDDLENDLYDAVRKVTDQ